MAQNGVQERVRERVQFSTIFWDPPANLVVQCYGHIDHLMLSTICSTDLLHTRIDL